MAGGILTTVAITAAGTIGGTMMIGVVIIGIVTTGVTADGVTAIGAAAMSSPEVTVDGPEVTADGVVDTANGMVVGTVAAEADTPSPMKDTAEVTITVDPARASNLTNTIV